MKQGRAVILLTGIFLLLGPLVAVSEPLREEIEKNRRQLEKTSAEELNRLRRNARFFLALPKEQQQQILQLDQDLQKEPRLRREHLQKVLEKYALWLKNLPAQERRMIESAPNSKARLEIIRQLREKQWLKKQPKTVRQEVEKLTGQKRAAFLHRIRREERQRQQDWLIASRFWDDLILKKSLLPVRPGDFPQKELPQFIKDYLEPMLSQEELNRLQEAEGKWPTFPRTLVELADRHPPALPGPKGPRYFAELPWEIQVRFSKALKGRKDVPPRFLKQAEGRWPQFAVHLTDFAKKRGLIFPHELWPYSFEGLSPQVKQFVERKLRPLLDSDEKLRLLHAEAEKKWPDFSLTLQDLAGKHHLPIPWQTLPGPQGYWDKYRLKPAGAR